MRTGQTTVEDVPSPGLTANGVLIRTTASLISAGTERMLVEFGKGSLLAKARSQPDKVKQVLDKIKTDGLIPTLEAVFTKLDEPLPLGYCNAGVVLEVGSNVKEFRPGDRVVSNGPHAEIVCVPKTLCAKIPEGVNDEQAAFTVLSSIALQGIRLLAPNLGERYVVYGLGLIGLIACQLLRAHGCDVLGVDLNPRRIAQAQAWGVAGVNPGEGADPVTAVETWTGGRGADGVLICASAPTDEIAHHAALMCRKRGRIVLVGVVGLNLRRGDFYEKELTFQVSCSYGPGRYDEKYEQGGQDYPFGFVRWTEQRNFEAVLESLGSGRLIVDDLIMHRYPIDQAVAAYDKLSADRDALGIVLQYPTEAQVQRRVRINEAQAAPAKQAVLGVIGAGNFSKMTLMPALSCTGARVEYIADLNGAAAHHLAAKFGAGNAVTDYKMMLQDPAVNAVLVAVRHDLHARFVLEALEAGKHVFVEKPLALNEEELGRILAAARAHSDRMIMVGFNRRFSPHVVKMKGLLAGRSEPLAMTMTVNAGYSPLTSWVQDPKVGGGRIIGEGCHFIDLMVHLSGSMVKTVSAAMMGGSVAVKEDKMSIVLSFEDGSVGVVNYFANGAKSYPKEKLEVFSDGRVLVLDNFRQLTGHGFKGFRKLKTWRQDKGHRAEFAAFADRVVSGGGAPIPLAELVNVTRASFAAMASAAEARTIALEEAGDVSPTTQS